MKLRLILAKYAEVQAGMLYGLGMGWTEIGPDPSGFTIAGLLDITWDETNRQHQLELTIVDADGQPVMVPTPTGDQPFRIGAGFDVGRPPGSQAGRTFVMPIAINLGPVPLRPGQAYVVRGAVGGIPLDEVSFAVRARPAGQGQAQPPQPGPDR